MQYILKKGNLFLTQVISRKDKIFHWSSEEPKVFNLKDAMSIFNDLKYVTLLTKGGVIINDKK